MALVKANLKAQMLQLMADMRQRTEVSDEEYADRFSTMIDEYIKSATITVGSGIPVSTTGTAAAQTGTTTAPKVATIQ